MLLSSLLIPQHEISMKTSVLGVICAIQFLVLMMIQKVKFRTKSYEYFSFINPSYDPCNNYFFNFICTVYPIWRFFTAGMLHKIARCPARRCSSSVKRCSSFARRSCSSTNKRSCSLRICDNSSSRFWFLTLIAYFSCCGARLSCSSRFPCRISARRVVTYTQVSYSMILARLSNSPGSACITRRHEEA